MHALTALRHPNFGWFIGGQLVALVGYWMQQIALTWLVYRLTGSAMLLGEQDHRSDGLEAIKRFFSPEFRNRLDATVQFAPLARETIASVVDKFVFELEQQLADKQVWLLVTPEARRWLAERGYDPLMGARPMARLIKDRIKQPLAEEILFGRLTGGGTVRVDVAAGELSFAYDTEAVLH